MMIWLIAVFSFLSGLIGHWFFSAAFILYFSVAAATAIASLQIAFARDIWFGLGVWSATIFAVQAGFVTSAALGAVYRSRIEAEVENRPTSDMDREPQPPSGSTTPTRGE